MPSKFPEEVVTLFKDFKEMQARHLAVLSGREAGSVRNFQEERQALLQRLQNWFETKAAASADPEFLKEELKSIFDREEELRLQADRRHREIQAEVETIRVGKKMLNRYSEKGYGLGDSPHFVTRTA
ncbi:MAG: hypothetical protein ACQES8_04720 [Thermodesulfobacteriota bacterium]